MSRDPHSRSAAALAVAGFTAVGVWACNKETTPPTSPSLEIYVSPATQADDGSSVDVTILATEANGAFGTGDVVVKPSAGLVGGKAEQTLTLANGQASTAWTCDRTKDANCKGTPSITATWNDLSSTSRATFGAASAPDAGFRDAGTHDAGGDDGGAPPNNTVTAGDYSLEVGLSKLRIYSGIGDYAAVAVSVLKKGSPAAGEKVKLSSDLAGLTLQDPKSASGSPVLLPQLDIPMDNNGRAKAWLQENGLQGLGALTATHELSGAVVQYPYEVTRVQSVLWTATKCGESDCTVMGIKGSGINEQAQVYFKVVDARNRPVPNINVSFRIDNPPGGVRVTPSAFTNAEGIAQANVASGRIIGAFAVRAIVLENQVEVSSGTIGIRGATPSNWGFSLRCTPVNIAAYVSAIPPASVNVTCRVKLVDRFNNPVGTGTPVNFKVEAGAIPTTATSKIYVANGDNTLEGTAEVVFSTIGAFPPRETEPLGEDPQQWPRPRDWEPQVTAGAVVRNPRDSLVTVLAYVRGEEYYQDNNGNGQWDPGEMFIDQGEPFVDSNDNGTWDPGELFIDVGEPGNGKWDPPNGKWDTNTTIWDEARILYTGSPELGKDFTEFHPNPFAPLCNTSDGTGGVPCGSRVPISLRFSDSYLNRPASGTKADLRFSNPLRTDQELLWVSDTLIDLYGFGMDRILVDAQTKKECLPSSISCQWRVLFYDWDRGGLMKGEILGRPGTCTPECAFERLFANFSSCEPEPLDPKHPYCTSSSMAIDGAFQ
jgi:hypothetical protein